MIRLVLTTFANAEDAAKAVRTLVDEKIIACGTILPGARSIYRWKDAVEDAGEAVVSLKTSVKGFRGWSTDYARSTLMRLPKSSRSIRRRYRSLTLIGSSIACPATNRRG
jgi:periplasmic divalent cation tolerance protein